MSGSISIFGATFSIPAAGAAALCVLVSLSLLGALICQVDQLIVDRYMNVLGSRIGMYYFELPLLNYTANNLWTTALLPKYFGLASGSGHKFIAAVYSAILLALLAVIFFFPGVVVVFKVIGVLSGNPMLLEVILCYFSLFSIFIAVIFVLIFLFNFKFRPSGTSEPTDPFVPEDFLDLGHPRSAIDADQEVPPEQS